MPENTPIEPPKAKKKPRRRAIARVTSAVTDGELAQISRVWARIMEDDLPKFQALDPNFNAAFLVQWRQDAENIESITTNSIMEALQQVKQQELQQACKAFFACVNDLEFYVKKAFSQQPYMADEFGLHKLRTQDAKRGVREVVLGYACLKSVLHYLAELTAAGMPATFPAQMEAALSQFTDAEVAHQYSLLESLRVTNRRIEAFNALFAKHQLVLSAAEVVFNGDDIKIKQYRL
ncbi:MAG: hypothetical protein IPN22_07055 [Bacteroidetes bacterium]|nr:hypothetical protein [Bacteroidota bacterium]